MSRLTPDNIELAKEIIGRYPRPKSALIPLLHLAQEQNGAHTALVGGPVEAVTARGADRPQQAVARLPGTQHVGAHSDPATELTDPHGHHLG